MPDEIAGDDPRGSNPPGGAVREPKESLKLLRTRRFGTCRRDIWYRTLLDAAVAVVVNPRRRAGARRRGMMGLDMTPGRDSKQVAAYKAHAYFDYHRF